IARSMVRVERASIAAGVSASAKSRADAGPVVSSLVRSESRQPTRMRKGSRLVCCATAASAVVFHDGAARSRRAIMRLIARASVSGRGTGSGGGAYRTGSQALPALVGGDDLVERQRRAGDEWLDADRTALDVADRAQRAAAWILVKDDLAVEGQRVVDD